MAEGLKLYHGTAPLGLEWGDAVAETAEEARARADDLNNDRMEKRVMGQRRKGR